MAEYVEFYVDQGTDFETFVTISNDTTNVTENVSSYVVTGQLRRSLLAQNASANLVCQLYDAANGEIRITLDAGNTANLRPGTYFFDLKVVQGQVDTFRLIEGIFVVTPAITR